LLLLFSLATIVAYPQSSWKLPYNKAATTPNTPASSATILLSPMSFTPPLLTTIVLGVEDTVTDFVGLAAVGVGVAGGIVFTIPEVDTEAAVEQTGLATKLVRLGQAERAELSCDW
jgi:hypothetical protein